jgi:pSer/pThr/pTyr-binding forkhead associated (FHA) protein
MTCDGQIEIARETMMKELDKSLSAAFAIGEQQAPDALKRQKPLGLILNIENGEAKLQISLRSPMMFGRSDAETTVDVDLTSFGGREKGLSRQHMTLVQQGNRLFVKDMGSKNGTRINDDTLHAQMYYELLGGDILRLSKLEMEVIFAYQSVQETQLPVGITTREETISGRNRVVDNTTYDVRPFSKEALQKRLSHNLNE